MITKTEFEEYYDSLSPKEKKEFDLAIEQDVADNIWIPLVDEKEIGRPTPQKQAADCDADILLYGGAAFGGKTNLICGLSLTAHKRTSIFRRKKEDVMPIAEELIKIRGTKKGYNSQLKRLNTEDGRNIRLAGMQYEQDKQSFKGDARDLFAFDEIVDFTESQFRFVITWNRSPDPKQRCRVICTTNPPTTNDGDWIIGYWGPWLDPDYDNPALPGELRWFISDEDGKDREVPGPDPVMVNGEPAYPKSRTFIPSSIDDNPFATVAYRATLQSLPEPLRSQMLTGDFLAGREDDPWQVIPTEWVEAAMDRWPEQKPPHLKMDTIGVDTARGGKDLFVLAPRYDWWFDELVVVNGEDVPDGPKGAALVTQHVKNGASINIDIIGGSGTSVYDHLKQNGANVNPVDGRHESHARDVTGSMGFFNKRAENYWRLREALDPEGGENIALPFDRLLKSDLTCVRWRMTSRGIQVEGKYTQTSDGFGDIIKRIGRSTDRADAVVYAFVEGKKAFTRFKRGPARQNSQYDVSKRWRKV